MLFNTYLTSTGSTAKFTSKTYWVITLSWTSGTQERLRMVTFMSLLSCGFCVVSSALQIFGFALWNLLKFLCFSVFSDYSWLDLRSQRVDLLFFFEVNQMPLAYEWSLIILIYTRMTEEGVPIFLPSTLRTPGTIQGTPVSVHLLIRVYPAGTPTGCIVTAHHSGKCVIAWAWSSWSHGVHSQNTQREGCWCLVHSLHFIHFGTKLIEMVPPTFKVSLPISVNPV